MSPLGNYMYSFSARQQVFFWPSPDLSPIGPNERNHTKSKSEHKGFLWKINMKASPEKYWPFCSRLKVLNTGNHQWCIVLPWYEQFCDFYTLSSNISIRKRHLEKSDNFILSRGYELTTLLSILEISYNDILIWKCFGHHWPSVRGVHWLHVTDHRWIPLIRSQ